MASLKSLISTLSRRHVEIILTGSTLLMLPSLFIGPDGYYDMLCQALWVKLFSLQFWHGDLYPRWLQDMYLGSGSPAFFFYPPLTYFITVFFFFLSPLAPFMYYPMMASCWLGLSMAGLTFYLWMKEETGNR